jgi:hypothetical protein
MPQGMPGRRCSAHPAVPFEPTEPGNTELPLISWAFLGYATGLMVGFSGPASGRAAIVGIGCCLAAAAARRGVAFCVGLLFVSGLLAAAVTPAPPPPWERPPAALEPVRSNLGERIDRLFGANAQVARALLIADQRQMPLEVRDRYADSRPGSHAVDFGTARLDHRQLDRAGAAGNALFAGERSRCRWFWCWATWRCSTGERPLSARP